MRIAVASGKGGTGKTTVSTNLAVAAARRGLSVAYIDCDVEEPNGQLFLKPQIEAARKTFRLHPQVDNDKCTLCGQCGEICQFSAIVCLARQVLVYPELCHACGGCSLVCRPRAISEATHETGVIESGHAGPMRFAQGELRVGEAISVPLIRELKREIGGEDLTIVDCPPGTSCPVVESVRGADLVLLVTEPTPFGLHDLQLAVEMVRGLHLPLAVVVNRAGIGNRKVYDYCARNDVALSIKIPDDRRVAEAYSRGGLAIDTVPEFRIVMNGLLERLCADYRLSANPNSTGGSR